jgi:hypothetical protein
LLTENEFRIEKHQQTTTGQIHMRLIDLQGSLVWQDNFSSGTQTIKLDQTIPAGLYTLILHEDTQIQIQKMIFQP